MDWNVFFSTISQTSGAIVGIFSAFLITKIISNQSEFSKLKSDATKNLIESESAEAEAKTRRFEWYNKQRMNRAMHRIDKHYCEHGMLLSPADYISKFKFSPFDSPDNINNAVTNKIHELSEKSEKIAASKNAMSPSLLKLQRMANTPSPFDESIELKKIELAERKDFDKLVITITNQAKKNKVLCEELKSGVDSVNLVTGSIVTVLFLFFAGVIYPLSFLPWQQGKDISLSLSAFWDIFLSLQGFMLFLISVIFSALMTVFLIINLRLKHSTETINKITYYSHIENYSPFLSNYIKNKAS